MDKKPELMNTAQAAEYLDLSVVYLRRLAKQGKIPAVRLGHTWRYLPERLIAWMDAGCPNMSQQPSLFDKIDAPQEVDAGQ